MLYMTYTVRGFDEGIKDRLRERVEPLFGGVQESELLLCSEAPPTWIELLASFVTWKTVLGVAATAFLKKLAERAADDLWNKKAAIKRALGDAGCSALKQMAEAIHAAQEDGGSNFSISLYFDKPEGLYGTVIALPREDAEEAAWYIANFVASADQIEAFVDGNVSPRTVVGPVGLTLLEDGSFEASWTTTDFVFHKVLVR